MSDYIVSARKYRPDSFDTLIGQETIARTLKNSIERGTIAHAYLFCGPRGVGKTSTARIFAKAINCSHPTADMEPCGECESCVSFREGRSYCIHELDAASNNGIDDIKALLDQVQIPPQVGRYGVYIIDEVHMLSQQAFNAFLKTLEEPPAHAIFILATTEKHKILPTILSRCQTYDFNRISVPDIVRNLSLIASREGVNIDSESLHVIAKKADGAMRDALTIFDQTVAFCGTDIHYADVIRNLNVLDYEYCFSLVDAFLAKDYGTALKIFDEVLTKGFNALHFVSSLSSHFRDLAVSKTAGLDMLLDLPDSLKEKYRAQADRCSLQYIYDALGITTQCEIGYKASVNPRLHIEYALMKLSFLQGVPQSQPAAAPEVPVAPVHRATAPATTPEPKAGPSVPDMVPAPAASEPKADKTIPEPKVDTVIPDSKDVKAVPEPNAKPAGAGKPAPKVLPSALSLASFMVEPADEPAEEDNYGDGILPSDEKLFEDWKELVSANEGKPRLANALANAALSVTEDGGKKTLVFEVTNEAQRGWIEEKLLRTLEETFRTITGSNKVMLKVVAAEFEEKKVAYMPEEKAKELMAENEEVKNLVIDLGLDIK